MQTLFKRIRKGFTLVELLVVIAILGILMGLLFPAINRALLNARATAQASNAKQIVTSIFAKEVESIYSTVAMGLPRYGESTVISNNQFKFTAEFFINLVTSGVLQVELAFFAPPGVVPAKGISTFEGTNHGWRVVGDVTDGFPETAPVLFTKNLSLTTLGEQINALGDGLPDKVYDMQPFGLKAFVFANKTGGAKRLLGEDMLVSSFTNLFNRAATRGTTNLGNRVLEP